jgi:thiol:disulfide interchange protein
MSPIPEFADALTEGMKSDNNSVTVVVKNNTVTERNIAGSETERNIESVPQSAGDMSRSAVDSAVCEDADAEQMTADTEPSKLSVIKQNEKLSQISGSPVEEHWLEVSRTEHIFLWDYINGITLSLHPCILWMWRLVEGLPLFLTLWHVLVILLCFFTLQ